MVKTKSTIVFMGTYPPRECGIATFTQDLLDSSQIYLGEDVNCKVAAFNLSPLDTYKYPPEVEWEIDQNSQQEHIDFANLVNNDLDISGVILQHEYGIFGGDDGVNILSFIENCKKPILVTLHTVMPDPSPDTKKVTERIIKRADVLVVLTNNSKELALKIYPEAQGKIFVIPHGIHPVEFSEPEEFKKKLELENHSIITTFGLLSRGKGIEFAIKALPAVIKKHPTLLYLILGETHPVIRRNEGEQYRIELSQLVTKLGLTSHVKFYDQYLSLRDLFKFLRATDIYISTSTNPNQAVSGTLSYALGTGRAVISTEFAQAKEIVNHDIGRLVPIQDPEALSTALLELLDQGTALKKMHLTAYTTTRSMLWSNVAKQYSKLLTRTMIPRVNTAHLRNMTDGYGLFQFAKLTAPNKAFGYTLDDNARALIVCSWLVTQKKLAKTDPLISIYLTFLKRCQLADGSFTNYIATDKTVTIQNTEEDLQDAQSRALWCLSEVISNMLLPSKIRHQATTMFLLALPRVAQITHRRARATIIKALTLAQQVLPMQRETLLKTIKKLANSLVEDLKNHTDKSWKWFDTHLTYNNAVLPESLITAGEITKNALYTKQGLETLQFLIDKTFSSTRYLPIGNSDWYENNNKRSHFDQQPEDPASMMLVLVAAYKATRDDKYRNLARTCFSWFLGNNSLNSPLYDYKTGGCYDGLHPDRVNLNQGAESLVSYLMSRLTIKEIYS